MIGSLSKAKDVLRDDPTNNVPDTIFAKLGMQLNRRDQHPLGILKNAIYKYFDTNYSNKFDKFDDLCPLVSVKEVQGKDRVVVRCVAEQLGLEGSYIPRTYIEQIQLEKLVNEVMALPDDLKTRLSIDEDLVLSPRDTLSKVSAAVMRNKHLKSGMSQSYTNQRDKDLDRVSERQDLEGNELKQETTLHELEPVAVHALHELVSLVHSHVNAAEQYDFE